MAGIDVAKAIPIESVEEFDGWLRAHGATEPELVIAIFKTSSGQQMVGFAPLLEAALCHGWVDSRTKSIDDERYAIRFVPRQAGWNWSERNRATAKRLLAEGRMTPAGIAALPPDL